MKTIKMTVKKEFKNRNLYEIVGNTFQSKLAINGGWNEINPVGRVEPH